MALPRLGRRGLQCMELIDLKAESRGYQSAMDRRRQQVVAQARFIAGPGMAELEKTLPEDQAFGRKPFAEFKNEARG